MLGQQDLENDLGNELNLKLMEQNLRLELEKYDKLFEPDTYLTTSWVDDFNRDKDSRKRLVKWWAEGIIFQVRADGFSPSIHLREPYIYAVAMVSRLLYGEPDATHVKEAEVPLIYTVFKQGSL